MDPLEFLAGAIVGSAVMWLIVALVNRIGDHSDGD